MCRMRRWIPVALLLAACSGEERPAPAAAGDAHSHDHEAHAHAPRYGGVLVELGDHEAQVELALDGETGTLTAYLWDGHVEEAVRSDMKSLRISLITGRDPLEIDLWPVTDPLTGEKAGDTSRFEATVERLKGAIAFDGILGDVTLRGRQYRGKAFEYREDEEHE